MEIERFADLLDELLAALYTCEPNIFLDPYC
jgi:hypothetical protein